MLFGIIDYGMGNLLSVKNALIAVGAQVAILDRGAQLTNAGAVVLPGVGAFGKGMAGLRERGFVDALEREVREKKKPMLGICLGMQLLATTGTELGTHEGLGWVPGTVRRFVLPAELRVPHMGWNDVRGRGPLFAGIPETASFYFVHSFHLVPNHGEVVSAVTDYGGDFASAVEHESVFAVQFHPEKSHKHGLQLLGNFVRIVKAA